MKRKKGNNLAKLKIGGDAGAQAVLQEYSQAAVTSPY